MASETHGDDEQQENSLAQRVAWLDGYIEAIPALSGDAAIDFCGAVLDLWRQGVTEQPPAPGSAAALVVLEVARVFAQVTMAAGLDDRVSRQAAEASMLGALEGVRNDARSWLGGELPSAEVIGARAEAAKAALKQALDTGANRVAEDDTADEYAMAHPYGAMLGYQDPAVDAAIIFTQVCEFTEAEHKRYSEACDRLRRLIDQDLFSYVSDMSDSFIDVVCAVLREIQDHTFSLSNLEESHKRVRRIRSALIAFESALHSHQEQTYYQVKQKFGDESDEHKAVRKLFHGIYSDSFAYRWLIELRHVMLHINIDAFTITMSARLHGEPSIELGVSRYWMSKSSGVMDKAYKRNELEAMTSDPSVLDMIRELQPVFGPLQDKLDAITFPAAEVAEDAATVRELIGRFNGRRGLYVLQTGPGFTRRLRTPSFSQLDPRVLAFAEQHEATVPETP